MPDSKHDAAHDFPGYEQIKETLIVIYLVIFFLMKDYDKKIVQNPLSKQKQRRQI